MLKLNFNRRLLWVALPAVLWAYLGLFAALAQLGPADKPPFGLRVGLPPGALELRGRLVEVREERDMLHITLAVPPDLPHHAFSPDGEPVEQPPPGLDLQFVTPQAAQGRELSVQTLRGQTAPIELRGPGHRQVIECEHYIVGLGPRGIALLPNQGRGLGLLEHLLDRRGDGRGDGRGAGGERGPGQGPDWRKRKLQHQPPGGPFDGQRNGPRDGSPPADPPPSGPPGQPGS